ncbi:MAG: FliA/WhiG family RNA polymerase sigma factor [Myxococcales bacterium]|nr:FliA/WhiG family RNA polymerase sigma factor [Myxococcales bacterium]
MIHELMPLVQRLARRLRARLPANVELDELVSAGVMGLMDAVDNYDPEREQHFQSYAALRVRGAMLDELRRLDWVPRSVREKARRLDAARRSCRNRLGRKPEDGELADALELNLEDLPAYVDEARPGGMYGYDDVHPGRAEDSGHFLETVAADEGPGLEERLASQDCKALILEALKPLAERQRVVLALYYVEGLTLREIGDILGVTESRISQLRALGMQEVRPVLREWLADA